MSIIKIHKSYNTILSLLFAFVISSVFLLCVSSNPLSVFQDIISGAFGSKFGITETLVISVPIILTALSVSLADRVGLLSIGAEGQLYLGAIGTTAFLEFINYSNYSPFVLLPLMMLFAMLFGGIWSLIPGYLKGKWNVNETLTTLLFSFIAVLLVQHLINTSFQDPNTFNWPQSSTFPSNAELPSFGQGRLHVGLFIALFFAIIIYVLYEKTRWGYISKIIGSNSSLASFYKLPKVKYILVFMMFSGAIAGLAGFVQVSGIEGRLRFPISLDYGFTGFLVSWLALHHPLKIIPIAIIMAGLLSGGDNVQLTQNLPFAFVKIIQGIVFITFLLFHKSDFLGKIKIKI